MVKGHLHEKMQPTTLKRMIDGETEEGATNHEVRNGVALSF